MRSCKSENECFPLRSESEYHSRERLSSAPLLSQGSQLAASGCWPLGWVFHRGGLRCTFQRRTGRGREVRVHFSFWIKNLEYNWSITVCPDKRTPEHLTRTSFSIFSFLVLGLHPLLFCRLVEVTCYGSRTTLYDLETAVPSVLKPDLTDV